MANHLFNWFLAGAEGSYEGAADRGGGGAGQGEGESTEDLSDCFDVSGL